MRQLTGCVSLWNILETRRLSLSSDFVGEASDSVAGKTMEGISGETGASPFDEGAFGLILLGRRIKDVTRSRTLLGFFGDGCFFSSSERAPKLLFELLESPSSTLR